MPIKVGDVVEYYGVEYPAAHGSIGRVVASLPENGNGPRLRVSFYPILSAAFIPEDHIVLEKFVCKLEGKCQP